MGQPESKPEPPVVIPFKDRPWRSVMGWDKSAKDELKSQIKGLNPTRFGVPTFNIVLTGQVGAGKSSLFNSINSVFDDFVRPTKAAAGSIGHSFTKEFKMYEFKHNPYISIGDTMGIEAHTTEADIRNILSVLDGHVPNGYKFRPDEEFIQSNNKHYIASPSLAERAHCVGLVINAKDTSTMKDEMVRKLKNLATALINRGVPVVVVLTHLDLFHPEVEEDITKTYHSRHLENLVDKIKAMIHGIPGNQIFAVINYHKAVELNDSMDVLLLYGLRCMIAAAEDYLENQGATAHPSEHN